MVFYSLLGIKNSKVFMNLSFNKKAKINQLKNTWNSIKLVSKLKIYYKNARKRLKPIQNNLVKDK